MPTIKASDETYNLPAIGTVVQTQILNSATRATSTSSNALIEVSSNYRVSITPKYSNSLITLQYMMIASPTNGAPGGSVARISAKRFVGGTPANVSSCGVSNPDRYPVAGYYARVANSDANDPLPLLVTALDYPATTDTVQYGFYFCSESGMTYIFGQSYGGASAFGVDANIVIIAQEIKQ